MKKLFMVTVALLAVQSATAADVQILTQEACASAIKAISGKKLSTTTYFLNGAAKYRPGDISYEITELKFSHEEGLQIGLNGEKVSAQQVTELKCVNNKTFKTIDIEAIGSKKLSFTVEVE